MCIFFPSGSETSRGVASNTLKSPTKIVAKHSYSSRMMFAPLQFDNFKKICIIYVHLSTILQSKAASWNFVALYTPVRSTCELKAIINIACAFRTYRIFFITIKKVRRDKMATKEEVHNALRNK